MKIDMRSLFCLASAILLSCPPNLIPGVDAFQKGRKRCQDAKAFGPVRDGLPCQVPALTCASTDPACPGIFDQGAQSCTDTHQRWTCARTRASGSTNRTAAAAAALAWSCPAAPRCPAPPDKRCTCQDDGSVKETLPCYREEMECPNYLNTMGCFNQWNDDLKVCENTTETLGYCHCYQGAWVCIYGDCRFPSYECDPDYYPDDYSP
jgi:hypothetical protein